MPVLKKREKKFPVEIKWLNSAWVAYQIKTSPAPLAYSSTPSSYVLWRPCCSSVITEGMLFCLQASWSSTQKGESPERQSYCLKRWDTGWDDGCLLTWTQLHCTSLQFPDGTPLHKSSPQSNPVLVAVPSEHTLAQQEHWVGSEIKTDLEVKFNVLITNWG